MAVLAALGVLSISIASPRDASSDHLPQPLTEITYPLSFGFSQPDMFGPGGLVPLPTDVSLLDYTWDEEESASAKTVLGGTLDFFGEDIPIPSATFGGSLTVETEGQLSVGAKMGGFDQGMVTVNYPGEAKLRFPRADTFRRGQTITIGSEFRASGGTLTTTAPTKGSVEVSGIFEAAVGLGVDLCIVDCLSSLDFVLPPIDFGDLEVPISCTDSTTLNFSVSLPSLELSLGALGLQVGAGIDQSSSFFKILDLTQKVEISPELVAIRLIEAVEKSRTTGQSLDTVLANDPVLGTYASMLPGAASDKLKIMAALLLAVREIEECVGAEAERAHKVSMVTTVLKNFTTLACCSGYVGLPQVETKSKLVGNSLVASGSHTFVDITVDPAAFFDPVKTVALQKLARQKGKELAGGPPQKPYPLQLDLSSCEALPGLHDVLNDVTDALLLARVTCATLDYDAVSAPYRIQMSQSQEFTFNANARVKIELPQAVQFSISPCTPDSATDPANPVVCSGVASTMVYDLGSDLNIVVPSGNFHTMDIRPTFFLLPTLDNSITTKVKVFDGELIAGRAEYQTPGFLLVESFEVIPEICVGEGQDRVCTPPLVFPGLGIDPKRQSKGPILTKSLPGLTLTESSLFDRAPAPWRVQGVAPVTGNPFRLDAEVKPTAVLTGPLTLNEGQEGIFNGSGSTEIDFGEYLTYSFGYGDGINDFSFNGLASHSYADNGTFTVRMVADDEHQQPGIATRQVVVNNVTPILTTGGRGADEGSLVDLSPPPFNRELLVNRGAEQGTDGWTVTGGVTTTPYGPQGTALPVRGKVLVNNSTPGYYADLSTVLNGADLPLFPSTYPDTVARAVLFPEIGFGGNGVVYGPGGSRDVGGPVGSLIVGPVGEPVWGEYGEENPAAILWFPEADFGGKSRLFGPEGNPFDYTGGLRRDSIVNGVDQRAIGLAMTGPTITLESNSHIFGDREVRADTFAVSYGPGGAPAYATSVCDLGFSTSADNCGFYLLSEFKSFMLKGSARGPEEAALGLGGGQPFPMKVYPTMVEEGPVDLGFGAHLIGSNWFGYGQDLTRRFQVRTGHTFTLDAGAELWAFREGGSGESSLVLLTRVQGPATGTVTSGADLLFLMPSDRGDTAIPALIVRDPEDQSDRLSEEERAALGLSANQKLLSVPTIAGPGGVAGPQCFNSACGTATVSPGFQMREAVTVDRSGLFDRYEQAFYWAPSGGIESATDRGQPLVLQDAAGNTRFYDYGFEDVLDIVPVKFFLKPGAEVALAVDTNLRGGHIRIDSRSQGLTGFLPVQPRSLVVLPGSSGGTGSISPFIPNVFVGRGDAIFMGEPANEEFLNVRPAPAPNSSALARLALPLNLGGWLGAARPTGGRWSPSPSAIPGTWPAGAENAIVYEIDGGEGGISNVVANFAVDNGIWVWVNGQFKFGAVENGADASLFEYIDIQLGNFPPGKSYVQVLRSDLGARNGWNVLITGTTQGDRPAVDTSGSFFRGSSFFFGGANSPGGSASQTINAAPSDGAARFIDAGDVVYDLSGYVGGHSLTQDSAKVTAIFRGQNGNELGRGSIGPISSATRGQVTRLKRLLATGAVPPGTRSVDVKMEMARSAGNDADGYVDDLSFKLLAPLGAFVQDPGLADTHSGTVSWGDGTAIETPLVDQNPGFAMFILRHVYRDNGAYTVEVVAQDDDYPSMVNGVATGRTSATFPVTITNLPPQVSGAPNFFSVGDPATVLVATFEDAGTLDAPWTATIHWGDGTTTTGNVNPTTKQVTGAHTYTAPGTGQRLEVFGKVIVTDKDGGSATGFFTNVVAVTKVPAVHASPDRSISEGGFITGLSGGFTSLSPGYGNVPLDIVYEYVWDYGDGTSFGPVTVSPRPASGGLKIEGLTAPDHRYEDNGQFVVSFRVLGVSASTGQAIAVGGDSFTVHSANAVPSVNAGPDVTVNENATLTRTVSFSDAGPVDSHSVTFDWGDGSRSSAGAINLAGKTASASHVYEGDGEYTVTVQVADDDGGIGSDAFLVTVPNSAPVVDAGPGQTATEGQTVRLAPATFTDGARDAAHTATVAWGDGTVEDGTVNDSSGTVAGAHVYPDNGPYTVTVCVKDEKDTGCDTLQVVVANVAPVVVPGSGKTVQEGDPVGIAVTSFFDAGAGDIHTATVTWGDGSAVEPGTVDQMLDQVSATHVYADDGVYPVTVRVCDDDGSCNSGALSITVSNALVEILSLQLTSSGGTLQEGAAVNLTANIKDRGTLDRHTATVDWGDGTPVGPAPVTESPSGPPGSAQGAMGTAQAAHHYADNGAYTVEVCVRDDENTTCQRHAIGVENVAPVVSAGPAQTVAEGAVLTLNWTFSDPGFDTASTKESFSATINWGDGAAEPAQEITLVKTPGGAGILSAGTVTASHAYGRYGSYTVEACLTDDDHNTRAVPLVNGQGCRTVTVTVSNVAPQVNAGPDRTWIEGAQFTLNPAQFSDAGYANQFTATVDWGDGATALPLEITLATSGGGEGRSVNGTVQAVHKYGDNGAYTITVCVSDGQAVACDTMIATILNLNPNLAEAFLQSATTFLGGDKAFLGQVGAQQVYQTSATDPGSDDLTFAWSFLPDTTSQSKTYFNNGTGPDGRPSSLGTFPYSATDPARVTFRAPGVYNVRVGVTDDDSGQDSVALPIVVVDTCQTTKIVPLWSQFYSDKGRTWASDATLQAYLDVVSFTSGVFSGLTKSDAQALLAPGGNDAQRQARQEAMAAWLNLANGSISWNATVPGGQRFHEAMSTIEAVLLNPASTKAQYDAAAALGSKINRMAIGNPACPAGGK